MVKPERFEAQDLGRVSIQARYLYSGLECQADDAGNVNVSPVFLRSRVFPYDEDVTVQQIEGWLTDLADIKRLLAYDIDGNRYAHLPTFKTDQRIKKPSEWRNPPPPVTPEFPTSLPPVESEDKDKSESEDKDKSESGTELSANAAENGLTQQQGTDIARLVKEAAINGDVVEALQAATFLEQHIDHDYLVDWLRAAAKLPDPPKHVSGVVEFVRSRAAGHKNHLPAYRVKGSPIGATAKEEW